MAWERVPEFVGRNMDFYSYKCFYIEQGLGVSRLTLDLASVDSVLST